MRFMRPIDRLLWWRRTASAGGSSPTVILNAAYLTDTLLNESDTAVGNGDRVHKWTMATGGLWTFALAESVGATVAPLNITASGVHTGGDNAALTCATPVTIPALATADWDVWVYCVLTGSGTLYPLGRSNANSASFIEIGVGGVIIVATDGGGNSTEESPPTAGTKLFRFGNVAGVTRLAWTGQADHAMLDEGFATGMVVDTLLAYAGGGSLSVFSGSGEYLKVIRAVTYPPGYADRASYRSTVETEIAGAALT